MKEEEEFFFEKKNQKTFARLWAAAPGLGVGALVLAFMFPGEIVAAVRVWDSSTAYGHCWLVLPIAAFLAYERRGQAAAAALRPDPALAAFGLPLVLLWIAADLLGIMEGRQLAVIGFVQVVLLAAFGPRLWLALAAALLYLVFLVPFGAFLTPSLQAFTTSFIAHGLNLAGIPHSVTANRIEIPEGIFYVAEACAGLRFLIASIAFGVLYALTMFISLWRRAAFIVASAAVPVIANGCRALGIVLLGHFLGSAQAAATDHLLYGWIFFSLVIAALAAAGLPFRQGLPRPPEPGPRPAPGTGWLVLQAVVPALALASAGPVLLRLIDRHGTPPRADAVLVAPPGCTEAPRQAAAPGAQDFICPGAHFTARLTLLPRGANPSRVVALAQAQPAALLPGADLDGGRLKLDHASPADWVLQRDEQTARAAAYVLFVDGMPALGGLRDRIRLARDMLGGAGPAPAVLAVAVTSSSADPVGPLGDFLSAQGDVTTRVAAVAGPVVGLQSSVVR